MQTTNSSQNTTADHFLYLNANQFVPAPWGNVRRKPRNPAKFNEFKENVRVCGIIQAVTARPHPELPNVYEILAGYGRIEAALEGDVIVPTLIKNVSDAEGLAIGLMENLQREDMTPVDEAFAAQAVLGSCSGDYEEAALTLGWDIKRLKQRLHLLRCIKPVLDAIDEPNPNGMRISLRHADLLAGISQEAQAKLLPSIIANKTSVEELKILLGKAVVSLSKARFDIKDCAACPHNSQQQENLFAEFAFDGATCRNMLCFKQKNADMVAQKRIELTERYGTIILFSEVNEKTLPRVSHDSVGSEQFFSGCISCSNRVALLDDRLDTSGDVHEDRCTKSDCFNNCVSKVKAAEQAQVIEAKSTGTGNASSSGAEVTGKKKSLKPSDHKNVDIAANLPSRVIEDNKKLLRQAAVAAWGSEQQESQRFQLAVTLAALRSVTGKSFGVELPAILSKSPDLNVIRENIKTALQHIATDLPVVGGNSMTDVMIKTLSHAPNTKQKAIEVWQPSFERLSLYTVPAIEQIMLQSGFQQAYVAANGGNEKAFKKLCNQGKEDLIKGIMGFPFDWSMFAPTTYLDGI